MAPSKRRASASQVEKKAAPRTRAKKKISLDHATVRENATAVTMEHLQPNMISKEEMLRLCPLPDLTASGSPTPEMKPYRKRPVATRKRGKSVIVVPGSSSDGEKRQQRGGVGSASTSDSDGDEGWEEVVEPGGPYQTSQCNALRQEDVVIEINPNAAAEEAKALKLEKQIQLAIARHERELADGCHQVGVFQGWWWLDGCNLVFHFRCTFSATWPICSST